ncbi:uncharacterized protein Bfra_011617 [Botrytis fragariae]|uniref:Uncharacterized protein n=1 Tax=Botrytis fragariae TaxID=1964551 RepID=A0A8H6AKR2_9HELO|nr:uncharacterized protein Bfra_011617 [Botrytis fragariae]KAF5869075.1 hypothetical protein Bfra_011617 [Botrytis fragariae]
MYHHRNYRRGEDYDHDHDNRREKYARPPARQDNEGRAWYPVIPALGVDISPAHKYTIHVYLIFHRFDNMESGNFVATMSFRTMFNDFGGMKTVDFSPATEDADPLFDVNGGNLSGVMVAQRTFMCKIGWLKRIEGKEEVYLRIRKCLPYATRPESMTNEEWEEMGVKRPESRTKWVLKAIRALKKERLWEGLPKNMFQTRHKEVIKVAWKKRKLIGLRPKPSFDMEQARCLDRIMNDVGMVLYSEQDEEPKKIQDKYRRRGDRRK